MNDSFHLKPTRLAQSWLAAPHASRSFRRRLMAIMRMACRMLGSKRRRGMLGIGVRVALVAVTVCTIAGYAPDALAADGIFVNDGSDGGCTAVNDGINSSPPVAGTTAEGRTAKCNPGDKASQSNRALFYNPTGSTGATSLTLGNELYVNGGFIGLNDQTNQAMRIGNGTTIATGKNSIAIGNGAQATQDGSMALGRGSITTAANAVASVVINGAPYDVSGGKPDSVLSVGSNDIKRQITNVAAGQVNKDSTDAVNGSQLFATHSAVGSLGGRVTKNEGDISNINMGRAGLVQQSAPEANLTVGKDTGGAAVDFRGMGGGPRKLIGVADGTVNDASLEAVNGGQLSKRDTKIDNLYNSLVSSIGGSAGASRAIGVFEPPAFVIQGKPFANVGGALAGVDGQFTLQSSTIKGLNDMAVKYAWTDLNGNGAVDTGEVDLKRVVLTGDGGTTISNVAKGAVTATSSEAINGSQFFGVSKNIAAFLGGGSGVDANGALTAPKYDIATVDASGRSVSNPYNNVGAALGGLNGSVTSINTRVGTIDTRVGDIDGRVNAITALAGDEANGRGVRYVRTNETGLTPGDAFAQGVGSTAIGYQARALQAGSVALGQNSITAAASRVTGTEINGTKFEFATFAETDPVTGAPNPGSVVSVGSATIKRQITNVAAGQLSESSTDVVNGSQLFATNSAVENVDSRVNQAQDKLTKTTKALGGGATIDGEKDTWTGPAYTLAKIGADGTSTKETFRDVGSALGALDGSVTTINTRVGDIDGRVVKHEGDINTINTSIASINSGTAGLVQQAKAGDNLTIGKDTDGAAVDLKGKAATRKLLSLSAGDVSSTSTDGVNGSQLFQTRSSLASALGGGASVGTGGTFTGPTYNIASIGVDGKATQETFHDVGGAFGGLNDSVTSINTRVGDITTQMSGLLSDALLWDPANSVFSAKHGASAASRIADVAAGEKDTDAVNVKQLNDAQTASGTALKNVGERAVKYAWEDKNGNGVVDPGEAIDYSKVVLEGPDNTGTKIGNVAAGQVSEKSLEAINGSQLFVTNSAIVLGLGGGAKFDANGVFTGPTYNITKIKGDGSTSSTPYNNVGGALDGLNENTTNINNRINAITKEVTTLDSDSLRWDKDKGVFTATRDKSSSIDTSPDTVKTSIITGITRGSLSATSTDAVTGAQLFETDEKVAKIDKRVETVETKIDTVKTDITNAMDKTAVKYAPDSSGNKTNEVALQGADPNAPVLISNVKEGAADHDAVNVKQLKETITQETAKVSNQYSQYLDGSKTYANEIGASTLSESRQYTDQKFDQLSSDIGAVRNEARQAAAIGLAASSLRFDNTPGKISVAVGGGVWRDQGAMAFGAGYTSESGAVRANLSGAASGGQVGVGAGISFTLN
ncbi:YadA-like family protein [Phyllobacterium sp. A18/5-2]|uniref:YadA-like family protein n=1 Tax=Phyllobacterium sp. A18/5-2 TaxID=2978392 RepID=UPI0021C61334|nr:YadA-like family protein [Phyllobacterium sp. A18/5-2]UXN63473.1 YadA-like family protein [Phyllobacterium sp. A18/5-2]